MSEPIGTHSEPTRVVLRAELPQDCFHGLVMGFHLLFCVMFMALSPWLSMVNHGYSWLSMVIHHGYSWLLDILGSADPVGSCIGSRATLSIMASLGAMLGVLGPVRKAMFGTLEPCWTSWSLLHRGCCQILSDPASDPELRCA